MTLRQFNASYLHMRKAVVVLALFSLLAFYPRYLGVIASPLPWYMHAHFILMVIWMIVLFIQPGFIEKKDFSNHRALGRLTYLLVPLMLISGYLMVRFGYHRILAELQAPGTLTNEEAVFQARINFALGPYYLFVLLIFYPLAIAFRKNSQVHSTFMVAAGLSIVGPIMDRAFYLIADWLRLPSLHLEYLTFFLVDVVLLGLLLSSYKKSLSIKANMVCLLIFIAGQVGYAFFLGSSGWQEFAAWCF